MTPSAMRRAAPGRNGSLTIIVLTPLTTFLAPAWNLADKRLKSLE
jgi:hypothetical protein